MATYLADTNLLLRLADAASSQHRIAADALAGLIGRGHEVYLTPQNFIEFWAVATRPVEANGFGWTSERTAKEVTDLQARFPLLPDSAEIFARWLELVKRLPVQGKRVHDARLVAALQTTIQALFLAMAGFETSNFSSSGLNAMRIRTRS